LCRCGLLLLQQGPHTLPTLVHSLTCSAAPTRSLNSLTRSLACSAARGLTASFKPAAGCRQVGAHDSHAVEQDPGQDAAHARQVPLPVQHARAQQGLPGHHPGNKGQVQGRQQGCC
jgi:hypothetical protein